MSGVSVRRVVVPGLEEELVVKKKSQSHAKKVPIIVNHFQVLSRVYKRYIV